MSMNRKYGQIGQSLLVKISRCKNPEIVFPGKVANLLLDTFVHNEGQLKAGQVEALGLCNPGEFKKWRDSLVRNGFLKPWSNGDYSTHRCGPKLAESVNRAKLKYEEVATKADLEKVLKSVDRIIDLIDPPANDEKRDRLHSGGYDEYIKARSRPALALVLDSEEDDSENPELFPNHQLQ